MRLIDADKLCARLSRNATPYFTVPDIENAPTVDDVAVTRCKNCLSYNKPKTGWCEVHLDREHPDDFSSYGERREGT